MSERGAAYCAGFFDGEGCVTIGKNGNLTVRIIGCHRPTLEMFVELFNGSLGERIQKVNKQQYSWSCYGDTAAAFLNSMYLYSFEKKEQIKVALDYHKKRKDLVAIRIEGKRGRFANPEREILVRETRKKLTELKKESS